MSLLFASDLPSPEREALFVDESQQQYLIRSADCFVGKCWAVTSCTERRAWISIITTSTDLFYGSLVFPPLLLIIVPVGSCSVQLGFQFLNLLHVTGPKSGQAGQLLHQPVVLFVLEEKTADVWGFIQNKEAVPFASHHLCHGI